MKLDSLALNWFDLLTMCVLVLGFMTGRKRGMSEEMLDVFQWLATVVVCAMLYKDLGQFLANFTHMDLAAGYVTAYLFTLVMISMVFSGIKRLVGEKLVHADAFGPLEYYLGMVAGGVRFFCMLFVLLALLHSKYVSAEQRAAELRMMKENFGTITVPTIAALQQTVFHESCFGMMIRQHLEAQMIEAVPPGVRAARPEPAARRKERMVDEIIK